MNKIVPLPPNRIWRTYTGGKKLDEVGNIQFPHDSHFPEDWIASLTRAVNPGREELAFEGLSKVKADGNEIYFKDLIGMYPVEMLGKNHIEKYGNHTAFLLKFLDSAIRLHFQCHPTIAFAKKFLNSDHGKTEGYYILGTREDIKEPYIYLGFQHPPSMEKLKSAIENQDIAYLESCFEKIPVQKGDAFYVPGGLPHAIGEGVFMIEIMEPTDLVARIEFEKAGYILPEKARFMDRGIDFALSMFDFSPLDVATIRDQYFIKPKQLGYEDGGNEQVIFDSTITNCFRLNKLEVKHSYLLQKDSFFIVIITGGCGKITEGNETYDAVFGDKFFIAAATHSVLITTDSIIEMVIAMPPL